MGFFDELMDAMAEGFALGIINALTGKRQGYCPDCHNPIQWNVKDGTGPFYCASCAKERQKGADMFRQDLIPFGWESSLIGNVQVHKDHSTMTFRGKGTNGETYRVSWDRYGDYHWTDEGVSEDHPLRHRDPR